MTAECLQSAFDSYMDVCTYGDDHTQWLVFIISYGVSIYMLLILHSFTVSKNLLIISVRGLNILC